MKNRVNDRLFLTFSEMFIVLLISKISNKANFCSKLYIPYFYFHGLRGEKKLSNSSSKKRKSLLIPNLTTKMINIGIHEFCLVKEISLRCFSTFKLCKKSYLSMKRFFCF